MKNVSSFEFRPVTVTKVNEEPLRLNPKKAFMIHNIPPRVLKENKEIFSPWLTKIFNNSISQNEFPDDLKLGDITSLFRKDEATGKHNYRPITVLSALSKVFERLLYSQITGLADKFLVPDLCGF